VFLGEDGVGRAFRDTDRAVDALVRVDYQKVRALTEAGDGTDVDAVGEFALDAVFGNDVGHARAPGLGISWAILWILPNAPRVSRHNPGGCSAVRRPPAHAMVWEKPLAMIIQSLLDTDLYKFTMMQVVLHHFPAAQVEYRYKCRTPGVNLRPYLDEIREEIHALCQLRFTEQELAYLGSLRFIKSDFVDFLGLFHLPEK